MKLFVKAIHKFDLRKGLTAHNGSTPPVHVAGVNIWIADDAFAACEAKHTPTLVADSPQFQQQDAEISVREYRPALAQGWFVGLLSLSIRINLVECVARRKPNASVAAVDLAW